MRASPSAVPYVPCTLCILTAAAVTEGRGSPLQVTGLAGQSAFAEQHFATFVRSDLVLLLDMHARLRKRLFRGCVARWSAREGARLTAGLFRSSSASPCAPGAGSCDSIIANAVRDVRSAAVPARSPPLG